MAESWKVIGILNTSRDYLSAKGFENARLESEMLLAHALSLTRIELYLQHDRQMSEAEIAGFKSLLKRRLAGEPVQYVTGSAAFMFNDFRVDSRVLIPRPETEALVESALKALTERAACETPTVVADVGTGSGVIAVTLALRLPGATVYASDIDDAIAGVARGNAERAGVGDQVRILVGSLFEPYGEEGLEGKLDAVVSNPPYIRSGDLEELPSEVRDFEPRAALDGGEDGLDYLRTIAHDGPRFLTEGGVLAVEVGDGQAEAVASMLVATLEEVEIRKDYAGRDRIVLGTKGTPAS
jgi:release factor glutamine methyltransferase